MSHDDQSDKRAYPATTGGVVGSAVFCAALAMLLLEIVFSKALLFLHLVGTPLSVIPVVFLGLALGSALCLYASGPRLLVGAAALLPWAMLLSLATLLSTSDVRLVTLMLALPFVCAGVVIAEGLRSRSLHGIYFADLFGAGCGVLILYFLLPRWGGELLLAVLFGLLGAVTLLSTRLLQPGSWRTAALLSGAAVLLLSLAGAALQLSRDGLNMLRLARQEVPFPDSMIGIKQLRNPRNKLLATRWGLVARIDVIESWDDPIGGLFRGVAFPEDSEFHRAAEANAGKPSVNFFYNDFFFSVISKTHYMVQKHFMLLHDHPSVLIVGLGGGDDIMRAREGGARRIVGVEINPETVQLMRGPLAAESNHAYDHAEIHVMDGRSFVHDTDETFDVITLFFADLFVPFPGSNVFLENYLYTLEAFHDYLAALNPGGVVYIGKWLNNYQENVELFRIMTTAWQALADAGVSDPGAHLVVMGLRLDSKDTFRGKDAGFLLLNKTPFTEEEVAKVLAASPPPYFPIYTPGRPGPTDLGRFFAAVDKAAFLASLPSDVAPTCDDRPFFYEFDRSHALQRRLLRQLVSVIILLLGPILGWFFLTRMPISGGRQLLDLGFFALLGLGYGMLQLSLIQRFNLFLGSPIYSMLTIMTAFLILGGLGAWLSRNWSAQTVLLATAAMLVLFLALHQGSPLIAQLGRRMGYEARCLLLFLFLTAPCILIGAPFPSYLRLSAPPHADTVAFYYAVNCIALVLGTLLSLYFSMLYGFSNLLLASLGCYALALLPLGLLTRR
ncbi:hypothetical protein HS125_18700 [bacterium]|nr:hypothetical protein [bacterium]